MKKKPIEQDDLDYAIMNSLTLDCKRPLRELAGRMKVSFVTIMNRIRQMEKDKVIKGYSARLDYEKLGYNVHVMIEMRISRGRLLELENRIAKLGNVYALYDVTGDFDAVVLARFKTTRQLDEFIKKIQTFDFVERTNTILILNTIKEREIAI